MNFWTLGDIATLRPNVINEFRAGVVILVSASSGELNGQAMMDQIGIQGLGRSTHALSPRHHRLQLSRMGRRVLSARSESDRLSFVLRALL